MSIKITVEDFIEKVKKIHGDKYDYSKTVYTGVKNKVSIICPIHGQFEQRADGHLDGRGCNKCTSMDRMSNLEEFIKSAVKIHGDKYDYSKTEYVGSNKKAIFICKRHGVFEQRMSGHLEGRGCKKCRQEKQKGSTEEFLIKACEIHGDRYDYSNTKYISAEEKLNIICRTHGLFKQLPSDHLAGKNCAICANKAHTKTQEQFINDAVKVHGETYDYSKVKYTVGKNKITIVCKKHGDFTQLAEGHLQGYGCALCAKENAKISEDEFINRAIKMHGNLYDYTKVKYGGGLNKIIIVCKKHGEFEQVANYHLRGCGCPSCGLEQRKLPYSEFFIRARNVHGEKYDYSKVEFTKTDDKVKIICKKHGEFKQLVLSHLRGCGCKKCANESSRVGHDSFIDSANKVHNFKYDYSKVEFTSARDKVSIICKKHGEFKQVVDNHMRGQGCPSCGTLAITMPQDEFVKLAKSKHEDKYNYENVHYVNSYTKVSITCPIHGEFKQNPDTHLRGCGCPKCGRVISKPEIEFLNALSIPKEDMQQRIKNFVVDGIDRNKKIAYEFLGDFWHGNPDRYDKNKINKVTKKKFGEMLNNTFKRFDKINEMGYSVRYIWENDWKQWKSGKTEKLLIETYEQNSSIHSKS